MYNASLQGKKFKNLYELIISENNILLAYRTIKANKGSMTAGTDRHTIEHYKQLEKSEFIALVRTKLEYYKPNAIKRVMIPKPNGDKRPLGIPSMIDRIIQQMIKQVLEPICEAKFYEHSYGFRPFRSTKDAIYRLMYLINIHKLNYTVDIDIKGFFDNVNHRKLIEQLWNFGICDKRVLSIISKSLKAPIKGVGVPAKGTPQGGILSPLLSNVVLNDLDHWVATQWHTFSTNYPYTKGYNKFRALRESNLKEGYIVRYADDFKILTTNYETAVKWFFAVKSYLKERLKLDISLEKSKIINLRKKRSEFLGYSFSVEKKSKKWICVSHISEKKQKQIKTEIKERIKIIKKNPNVKNLLNYNSLILGIQNYFRYATCVNLDLSKIHFDLSVLTYNQLIRIGTKCFPNKASPVYKKYYSINWKTYYVNGVYLYPLSNISTKTIYGFDQSTSPYTVKGREIIEHKYLRKEIESQTKKLMVSNLPSKSIEYLDNRISRYSMKQGKCEILNTFLEAKDVHCHHYLPTSLGGTDTFDNLRIIHKKVHKLIHLKSEKLINECLVELNLSQEQTRKTNEYRKKCNLLEIS